eukprot:scaffold25998_cov63-Phaeocystis_antarctica.AAC.2
MDVFTEFRRGKTTRKPGIRALYPFRQLPGASPHRSRYVSSFATNAALVQPAALQVQTVAVLGNRRLHRGDTIGRDGGKCLNRVERAIDDTVHVQGDRSAVNPRAPVPRPLELLTRMKKDRDTTEQDRVDDSRARHAVPNGLQAEDTAPVERCDAGDA